MLNTSSHNDGPPEHLALGPVRPVEGSDQQQGEGEAEPQQGEEHVGEVRHREHSCSPHPRSLGPQAAVLQSAAGPCHEHREQRHRRVQHQQRGQGVLRQSRGENISRYIKIFTEVRK